MDNKIELSKEKRKDMISAIKTYFLKEREEELGDLASSFLIQSYLCHRHGLSLPSAV